MRAELLSYTVGRGGQGEKNGEELNMVGEVSRSQVLKGLGHVC